MSCRGALIRHRWHLIRYSSGPLSRRSRLPHWPANWLKGGTMYEVKQVTSDAGQTQSLILPDGTTVTITMVFIPMQYGWFFSNITYGSFVLENIRICNSPNLLHQWRNLIPF